MMNKEKSEERSFDLENPNPEVAERKLLESKLAETGHLALAIQNAGGQALVVGGFARDEAMRRLGMTSENSKDIDIEVYGLPIEKLMEVLKPFGDTKLTGEAFCVIKLGDFDISIPRRDSKTGAGHKGFKIEGDSDMSPREAARRRDLTINALALDPLIGEIVDEHGGMEDLKNGVLRATDYELFGDDPLRVSRLMQFAGRFGFEIEEQTLALAKTLPIEEEPIERNTVEWQKMLLKSKQPSKGLEAARKLDIIKKLYPELYGLIGVPQENEWHPEGDVWIHTCMVVDAAAEIARREGLNEEETLCLLLAALCHDLGKSTTTVYTANKKGEMAWRSHAHDISGVEPTKSFLRRFIFKDDIVNKVIPLVREHLFPGLNRNASDRALRGLAVRLVPATINELVMVSESDHRGRALPQDDYSAGRELIEKATILGIKDSEPKKLLLGRHLLDMGMKPGVPVGMTIEEVFAAQLDGTVKTFEEAKVLALEIIQSGKYSGYKFKPKKQFNDKIGK